MTKRMLIAGIFLAMMTGCAKSYDCSDPGVLASISDLKSTNSNNKLSFELPPDMTKHLPGPDQVKITDIKTVEHDGNNSYTCTAKASITFPQPIKLSKEMEDIAKGMNMTGFFNDLDYSGRILTSPIGYTVYRDSDGKGATIKGDEDFNAFKTLAYFIAASVGNTN